MWTNHQSLEKQHAKLDAFKPPYCTNPFCAWHFPKNIDKPNPFQKYGSKAIQRWPYVSPRFRCNNCKKTFAQSFFTLHYRDKQYDCYEEIHDMILNCASKKAIARKLKIDEDTVRRRKKKLARWGLLAWQKDLETLKVKEPVAYDGLENFAYSQYDPNNVNHAVGKESLYVYDFNLSPMNRKGKMNAHQKRVKKVLEEVFGKYDGHSIQKNTKKIFERLLAKSEKELHLHTDNHYAYRRAINQIKDKNRFVHVITPAKITRNYRNALFAINHTDMLTRHQTGDFKRETIGFAKHTIAMVETFVLFATYKNYLRPQFWRKHKRKPDRHITSPAMALGLRPKIQSFSEFYRTRISVHHVKLNEDWQDYFDSTDLSSRRCIRAYAGI